MSKLRIATDSIWNEREELYHEGNCLWTPFKIPQKVVQIHEHETVQFELKTRIFPLIFFGGPEGLSYNLNPHLVHKNVYHEVSVRILVLFSFAGSDKKSVRIVKG